MTTPPRIEVLSVDMNGIVRGKWLPMEAESKLFDSKVRLPLSTQSLDIWGLENDDLTGLAASIGDPDGILEPDRRTYVPVPWAPDGSMQVLTSMHDLDGRPSFMEPRTILASVIDRYAQRGLTPVVATELEFYLVDADWTTTGRLRPPDALSIGQSPRGGQLYELASMDLCEPFLSAVRHYAATQSIPAETAIAEVGRGQFEVNLIHRPDALAAADDAVMFKRVVQQAARACGLYATFLAKPYTDDIGSGLHVHASIVDAAGNNVLDAGDGPPTQLKSVVAGILSSLLETQALLAPHANSYRRFQPGLHAPVGINWGFEHRGAAVRIPEQKGPGARIEHRVAGADANPYFVVAAVLAGMLKGLDEGDDPGPDVGPVAAVAEPGARLASEWMTAIDNLDSSDFARDLLGTRYHDLYVRVKRHEATTYARTVSSFDIETYAPRI